MEPANWPSVVGRIADLVLAERALLLTPGSGRAADLLHASTNGAGQALIPYAQHYHAYDPYLIGARDKRLFRAGVVAVDSELVERRTFVASGYFNEFARCFHLNRAVALCISGESGNPARPPTVLTLYRERDEEFEPGDVAVLRHLSPHLTLAVQNYWRWIGVREEALFLNASLDRVDAAVFAIAEDCSVRFANAAAERELSTGHWLTMANGRLIASAALAEPSHLERALRAAANGHGASLHVRSNDGAMAIVTGVPYPVSAGASRAVTALLWLIPARAGVGAVRVLANLFALSQAECRLLERLARAEDLKDAASQLGIAVNTARAQLKSIFQKTGRKRQSELLALVNRIAALRFDGSDAPQGPR